MKKTGILGMSLLFLFCIGRGQVAHADVISRQAYATLAHDCRVAAEKPCTPSEAENLLERLDAGNANREPQQSQTSSNNKA